MNRLMLIYGGVAAAMIIGAALFLISPAWERQAALDSQIKAGEAQIESLKLEVSQLPEILKRQKILTDEESLRAGDLFTRNEVLSLLSKIGLHCQQHRLAVDEIRPPVEELIALNRRNLNSPEPNFLNITLVLTGSYKSYGEFVIALEQAPYFRGINYSRINAQADGEKPAQYIVEFKTLLGRIGESSG